MRIAIITDTYTPQSDEVSTTLANLVRELEKTDEVLVIHPLMFKTKKFKYYTSIDITRNLWKVISILEEFKPEAIHIATEGPLGLFSAIFCKLSSIDYNSSFNIKWHEIVREHKYVPSFLIYKVLKLVHKYSHNVLVANNSLKEELEKQGFKNLKNWTRGIDFATFKPSKRKDLNLPKPIWITMNRVSPEKNIKDFLDLDLPGTKIVIGDGPFLKQYQSLYPSIIFLGDIPREQTSEYFASSDVFIFPSKSDAFGLPMLKAIGSGIPVAAYDVMGPREIVTNGVNGILSDDLKEAALKCLHIDKEDIISSSKKWSWKECARLFKENLIEIEYYKLIPS